MKAACRAALHGRPGCSTCFSVHCDGNPHQLCTHRVGGSSLSINGDKPCTAHTGCQFSERGCRIYHAKLHRLLRLDASTGSAELLGSGAFSPSPNKVNCCPFADTGLLVAVGSPYAFRKVCSRASSELNSNSRKRPPIQQHRIARCEQFLHRTECLGRLQWRLTCG